MKKKLILGLLALGAGSMLCGFDSAETAQSVMEKAAENTASIEDMSSDITLNCDVSVNIGDGTTTSTIEDLIAADLDLQATLDPVAMAMDGTVSLSTFGQSEEIIMQMYTVSSEDTVDTYVYTEDSAYDEEGEGTWTYESASGIDIESLIELSESLDYSEMTEWGLDFTLASEAADYNGAECYLLTSVIDSSALSAILEKTEELAGEELTEGEDLSEAMELLDGLKISIEYYIDTASYLPIAMHIDLNGSDLSAISEYAAALLGVSDDEETTTTVEIILNDVSMDYTLSYEDVGEITVPDEALAAIAAQEAEEAGAATEISEEEVLLEG